MEKKIIVKLTTPWHNVPYSLTPGGAGVFGDYKFEIDNNCNECDFWIVWGGLNKTEIVNCPPDNVIYITDEAHENRHFNVNFLNQFPIVFSLREDVEHYNIKKIHEIGIWHFPKSYDEIVNLRPSVKAKELSIVSSDRTELRGHKKRFAFTHILIGHFKDRIDVYGRGINSIDDKSMALAPYNFTVAIENSIVPGYFTEKLFECFLNYTMPFYYGCPNIEDYFPGASLIKIDIANYKNSIAIIESAISDNMYRKNLDSIIESRNIYLKDFYIFHSLIKFLKQYNDQFSHKKKEKIKLKSELHPSFHLKKNVEIIFKKIATKFNKL